MFIHIWTGLINIRVRLCGSESFLRIWIFTRVYDRICFSLSRGRLYIFRSSVAPRVHIIRARNYMSGAATDILGGANMCLLVMSFHSRSIVWCTWLHLGSGATLSAKSNLVYLGKPNIYWGHHRSTYLRTKILCWH